MKKSQKQSQEKSQEKLIFLLLLIIYQSDMLPAFIVKRRVLFQQKENVELLIVFENRKVVDITTIKQKKNVS